MIKDIKWLALIALVLVGLGFWLRGLIMPPKPVIVTKTEIKNLTREQKDSIDTYWKGRINIITRSIKIRPNRADPAKRDTIWQTDSTEINGWINEVFRLNSRIEELTDRTTTGPDNKPLDKPQHVNIGIAAGGSYGLKDRSIAPWAALPVRYRHVLFQPFGEYVNDQVRAGAGVGLTF